MQQPHRKRVRHFEEPGHVHELTFSCYRRLPLLTNDDWRQQLCTAIDRAIVRHRNRLLAFVLMPEHVHLVVHPLPDCSPVRQGGMATALSGHVGGSRDTP